MTDDGLLTEIEQLAEKVGCTDLKKLIDRLLERRPYSLVGSWKVPEVNVIFNKIQQKFDVLEFFIQFFSLLQFGHFSLTCNININWARSILFYKVMFKRSLVIAQIFRFSNL